MDQAIYESALRKNIFGTSENISKVQTLTFDRKGSMMFSRLLVNLMNPSFPSDIPILESLGKRILSAVSYAGVSEEISFQVNMAELKMLAEYVEPIVMNAKGFPENLVSLVSHICDRSKAN